jgi:hypothetical protein
MPNAAQEGDWVPEKLRRRLPVDFPVTLEAISAERREVGAVANLSARGIFAASRMLLPAGTPLRVTFYLPLPAGARPIVASARVRWVNDPEAPRAPDLPGGMGLEFVGLDVRSKADLERFLEDLMAPVV